MACTHLGLANQLCQRLAQVKRLLETTAGLALRRIFGSGHIAIVAVPDLRGALLPRRSLLLLSRFAGCSVASASCPSPGHSVLLSLQLGRKLGVRIFRRILAFLLLSDGGDRNLDLAVPLVFVVAVRFSLGGRTGRVFGSGILRRAGNGVKAVLYQSFDGIL